jgi:3-methyladenine DNA glycosylase AlkD
MPRKPANDKGRALSAALAKDQARALLDELEPLGSEENREGMARYGIVADRIFGITIPVLRDLAKRVGRNHDLALALWDTGYHEARILATLVDEPDKVTSRQMDEWARDFDNWAVCDAACMNLFDRVEHAWVKVDAWSHHEDEFVKRGAFALIASIAQHDKRASIDDRFIDALALIERESTDDRNFVKKAVNWALRAIGKRNPAMRDRAVEVAERLAASSNKTAKWIGKDAFKKLTASGASE